MILTLTKNEAQALSEICPPKITEQIGKPGVFTIGSFEDENFLEGILQFTVDKNDKNPVGQIKFLYVQRVFRNKHVGSSLIESAIITMEASNVRRCLVMLPTNDRYADLREFFSKRGFSFGNNLAKMSSTDKYCIGTMVLDTY